MHKIKIIFLGFLTLLINFPTMNIVAEDCKDLHFVFIRGSGGEQYKNADYLEFKKTIEQKVSTLNLDYTFTDLNYPAVSVGIDNFGVMLGALISGGESYDFGESVNIGVENLVNLVNKSCNKTKFIIGGYSQGAMVISKAMQKINPNKIIYLATFGDPKLYLPEGEGLFPDACVGKNLSNYRAYVPECHTTEGIFGGNKPYQTPEYIDKLGVWCNKHDVICSGFLNINDHTSYISELLYEDASRVIYNKIIDFYGLEQKYFAKHDTVILLDITGSMRDMIEKYSKEAERLAKETLENDGRIALYGYRDLVDSEPLVEFCNFDNCTLENIKSELSKITASNGGDLKESLLSGSFKIMSKSKWRYGAVKSLIVLTDAGFHSPDLDGITLDQVVTLSRSIDPINFYIITENTDIPEHNELAAKTDGKVVNIDNEISILTDTIMKRSDSLNKVDLCDKTLQKPLIKNLHLEKSTVSFETDGDKILVILNDKILGTTTENTITFTDLDVNKNNKITLIPIKDDVLGNRISAEITFFPAVPNTGTLKYLDR